MEREYHEKTQGIGGYGYGNGWNMNFIYISNSQDNIVEIDFFVNDTSGEIEPMTLPSGKRKQYGRYQTILSHPEVGEVTEKDKQCAMWR